MTKSYSTRKRVQDSNGESGNLSLFTSSPKCPECGSGKTWKAGKRKTGFVSIQRFLCRTCGLRFSDASKRTVKDNILVKLSEASKSVSDLCDLKSRDLIPTKQRLHDSSFSLRKDVGSHGERSLPIPTAGKILNTFYPNSRNHRVGAEKGKAKNLVKVTETHSNRGLGGILTSEQTSDAKGKIVEFLWYLKKQGYAESTIRTYVHLIKLFDKRGANIFDPESVKKIIAIQDWSKARKNNAVKAYSLFLKMQGLTWEKPKYKPIEKLPFIPTEQEIDDLIAGCGSQQMACFLLVLKETGARRGEAFKIKWTDIDFVSNTIRINSPEKGSKARIFKMTPQLINMLNLLPKNEERVFQYATTYNLERAFRRSRNKITVRLGNPRLKRIHMHTFRHWKATIEYAKTKDILYVQQMLGHKNLKNTLLYTQLVDFPHEEQFICKVARTHAEANDLIEDGFEYVCTSPEEVMLFRKRKTTFLGSRLENTMGWT